MSEHVATADAAALTRAGWDRVLDRILQGIGHDLNNRVQSLLSLVQLVQLDEEVSSLAPFLEKEVDHLEEVVTLLRLLPGQPDEPEELIHLPDVLPRLVRINRIQKDLESVERSLEMEKDGLMPVRARWTCLSRSILVFLSGAAREAELRGRRLDLTVTNGGDRLAIRADAPGARSRDGDSRPPAARLAAFHDVATVMGGSFTSRSGEEGARFLLELPQVGR